MNGAAPGLVIFDCDGVLVDSEPIAAAVMAAAVSELGLPMSAADCLRRFTGIAMAKVIAEIEADLGRPLPADFVTRVRERDFEAFRRDLKPIAGADAVVGALAMPKCVASSGASEKIRFTLGITGLLALFEPHLFSAEMVRHGKPAPDLFLFAAKQMQATPADSVVVEDSEAGIRAARAAGMRALGFIGGSHCGPGHAGLLQAAGAHAMFRHMADLPRMLAAASNPAPN